MSEAFHPLLHLIARVGSIVEKRFNVVSFERPIRLSRRVMLHYLPLGAFIDGKTESFERLNKALALAKGGPLSERMASGRPRSRNSRSKAVRAVSSRVDSSASHSSRKREAWSVTVSG
jgi:hypothetical protein